MLFRTTKDFMRVYITLVPMVICKRKRVNKELTNGGPPGAMVGCPMRGLLL